MLKFRHITASFTLCDPGHDHDHICQWGKKFPTEAIEWIGTGLAIQHLYHPTTLQEYYGIVHIASDRLLTGSTTYYIVEAALWLQLLKNVTDWTQPAKALQANEELSQRVRAMRDQAFRRYNQMRGVRRFEYSPSPTASIEE